MDEVIPLDLPEFPPRTPTPQPLGEEIRTYTRLLAAYRGRYVAILGESVVGHGSDLFAVLERAYAEYGYRPILCRLVTDQPSRVVRMPSVRVHRG